MTDTQPRVKSICLAWRNEEVLVIRAFEEAKALTYFTPIGGGVKFGERGSEAVAREFKEEIGGTIEGVRFLGMLENLFTLEGKPKHEIVLVYEGRLMESSFYDREVIQGEDTGGPFKAVWKPLSSFHATDTPLYPEGLLELLGRFHKNAFQPQINNENNSSQ